MNSQGLEANGFDVLLKSRIARVLGVIRAGKAAKSFRSLLMEGKLLVSRTSGLLEIETANPRSAPYPSPICPSEHP